MANNICPLGDQGPSTSQTDFPKTPYITVELRDRITDRTIIFLPQAWVFRRTGSVEAENLLTETWSIKSIGYRGPQQQGLQEIFQRLSSNVSSLF